MFGRSAISHPSMQRPSCRRRPQVAPLSPSVVHSRRFGITTRRIYPRGNARLLWEGSMSPWCGPPPRLPCTRSLRSFAVDGSSPKSDFATLLHHRIDELLMLSGRVAKKRTSENSQKAKFAEYLFHALG